MATYNFVVDGSFVNISGVANTHSRLHNSSQAIEWFYDGSGDLVFSIDDAPYLVKDMSDVIIDGVTLTDPSEFETNIKLIFPGYAGGSVAGFTSGAKLYVALLTQTGTNAPVATVLQNTLGGTVVWTRANTGSYAGTLAGAFTENKIWHNYDTWQQKDLNGDATTIFRMSRGDDDNMLITSVTSLANDTPADLGAIIMIMIIVYP